MAVIASSASSTQTATVTLTDWWLKDPLDATRNMTICIAGPHQTSKKETQARFEPIGRTRPVYVADTILGEDGRLHLEFWTDSEATAFDLLRGGQRTLLIQSPRGKQWYARLGEDRESSFEFAHDTTDYRVITIDFGEVDMPPTD